MLDVCLHCRQALYLHLPKRKPAALARCQGEKMAHNSGGSPVTRGQTFGIRLLPPCGMPTLTHDLRRSSSGQQSRPRPRLRPASRRPASRPSGPTLHRARRSSPVPRVSNAGFTSGAALRVGGARSVRCN